MYILASSLEICDCGSLVLNEIRKIDFLTYYTKHVNYFIPPRAEHRLILLYVRARCSSRVDARAHYTFTIVADNSCSSAIFDMILAFFDFGG